MENHNKPQSLLSSTQIGRYFKISANKTNWALSELGWIISESKGWQTTNAGIALGAVQTKEKVTGTPYVRWPVNILDDKIFKAKVHEVSNKVSPKQQDSETLKGYEQLNFRDKYPTPFMTEDGHRVRSKSEMIIDNWLYNHNVVHAYEKKIPDIKEDLTADFYVPRAKVYLEYWGIINNPIYTKKRTKKLETYKRNMFDLIELTDKEIDNLDDFLTRELIQRGIKFD